MNIYKRQGNLIRQDQLSFPILLIGAGGIGSWAFTALKKMGCSNITVVDFDRVENHNTASQAYTIHDVGELKVWALAKEDKRYGESFEKFFSERVDPEPCYPVVICALDSMDARIRLWDIIKERNDIDLYLDARMGGELLRVYAVDPLDTNAIKFYEKKLYPSSKADPLPCGSRSIVYTTLFAGAVVASYVKKYARKEPIKAETIMDFSTMTFV